MSDIPSVPTDKNLLSVFKKNVSKRLEKVGIKKRKSDNRRENADHLDLTSKPKTLYSEPTFDTRGNAARLDFTNHYDLPSIGEAKAALNKIALQVKSPELSRKSFQSLPTVTEETTKDFSATTKIIKKD